MRSARVLFALASSSLVILASGALAQQGGGRGPGGPGGGGGGGQAQVEVPAEHAAMGKVYRVHPVKDAQVTFTSDAALEHIKGISNRVSGYAVAPTPGSGGSSSGADKPEGALLVGTFELPVASMDTGIPMRNEHLRGDRWLGAGTHPSITFVIKGSESVTLAKEESWFRTYDATLVGDMTVKGVTREMKIPARLTFMPESDRTKARAPGDLLAIRAQYSIKLSDFGVAVGDQAIESGMVSNELGLDTFLLLTTFDPARRAQDARPARPGNQQ